VIDVVAGIGFPETLRLLLRHGAHVNAADKSGRTALMYAAAERPYYDHSQVGDLSCYAGPDVSSIKARLLLGSGADLVTKVPASNYA
jgi:hypothetical protein